MPPRIDLERPARVEHREEWHVDTVAAAVEFHVEFEGMRQDFFRCQLLRPVATGDEHVIGPQMNAILEADVPIDRRAGRRRGHDECNDREEDRSRRHLFRPDFLQGPAENTSKPSHVDVRPCDRLTRLPPTGRIHRGQSADATALQSDCLHRRAIPPDGCRDYCARNRPSQQPLIRLETARDLAMARRSQIGPCGVWSQSQNVCGTNVLY